MSNRRFVSTFKKIDIISLMFVNKAFIKSRKNILIERKGIYFFEENNVGFIILCGDFSQKYLRKCITKILRRRIILIDSITILSELPKQKLLKKICKFKIFSKREFYIILDKKVIGGAYAFRDSNNLSHALLKISAEYGSKEVEKFYLIKDKLGSFINGKFSILYDSLPTYIENIKKISINRPIKKRRIIELFYIILLVANIILLPFMFYSAYVSSKYDFVYGRDVLYPDSIYPRYLIVTFKQSVVRDYLNDFFLTDDDNNIKLIFLLDTIARKYHSSLFKELETNYHIPNYALSYIYNNGLSETIIPFLKKNNYHFNKIKSNFDVNSLFFLFKNLDLININDLEKITQAQINNLNYYCENYRIIKNKDLYGKDIFVQSLFKTRPISKNISDKDLEYFCTSGTRDFFYEMIESLSNINGSFFDYISFFNKQISIKLKNAKEVNDSVYILNAILRKKILNTDIVLFKDGAHIDLSTDLNTLKTSLLQEFTKEFAVENINELSIQLRRLYPLIDGKNREIINSFYESLLEDYTDKYVSAYMEIYYSLSKNKFNNITPENVDDVIKRLDLFFVNKRIKTFDVLEYIKENTFFNEHEIIGKLERDIFVDKINFIFKEDNTQINQKNFEEAIKDFRSFDINNEENRKLNFCETRESQSNVCNVLISINDYLYDLNQFSRFKKNVSIFNQYIITNFHGDFGKKQLENLSSFDIDIFNKININKYENNELIEKYYQSNIELYNKLSLLKNLIYKDGIPKPIDVEVSMNNSLPEDVLFIGLVIDGEEYNIFNRTVDSFTIAIPWNKNIVIKMIIKLNNGEYLTKSFDGDISIMQLLSMSKDDGDNNYIWEFSRSRKEDVNVRLNIKSKALELISNIKNMVRNSI
ncbi:hypothetical protein [Francisella frigiditurris]|uniref:hypothetical protein n=1 Tax=Francisella frigiditurris TaxID=1542390 RepID=UPI0012ECA09F|nr:hypothetical protein [Francisella frigiditurris]